MCISDLFKQKKSKAKKPKSSREHRFSFLLVYSHGKTRTLSVSLTTVLAMCIVTCMLITGFGFFVRSYVKTSKKNQELNYLYEVAGVQEQQIQHLQEYLEQLAERIRQTELAESETRNMLLQEGLMEQSSTGLEAAIASRESAIAVTSRSSRFRRNHISVYSIGSTLVFMDKIAVGLDNQVSSLEERVDGLHESAVEAIAYSRAQPKIWPVYGSVTSKYGWRRHPISRRHHFHQGIDIGAQYRTPIRVTADGTVNFVGYKAGYGRTIIVSHGYGFETLYSHCNSISVSVGEKVNRGDIIGYVGSSGSATGPHLHYEIHKNGETKDPLEFLSD